VRGEAETARQILAYTVLLVGASLAPFAWRSVGLAYVAAALVLGGIFLALAWRLRAETSPRRAAALFHYSLLYLALLFVMLAIDPLLT
jgi:protoheme IX farnesyltransferase